MRMEGELSEGETRNYIHTGESQHFKLPSHSHTHTHKPVRAKRCFTIGSVIMQRQKMNMYATLVFASEAGPPG